MAKLAIQSNSESPRKQRALLVAIRHVTRKAEFKFGNLPDLRVAHRDAKELRSFLIDAHGYHPDDIILMMDDKNLEKHLWPTRSRILHQIDLLTKNAPEGGHFFFYYSGYRLEEEGGDDDRDPEIVCADGKPIFDYILHDRLVTPLHHVKGSKLFALIDCCPSERDRPNTYSRLWTISRGGFFKTLVVVIVRLLQLYKMCRKTPPCAPLPPRRASPKWQSPPTAMTKEVGELSISLSACRDGLLARDDCEHVPLPPRRASPKWQSPPTAMTNEVGELSVISLSACGDGLLAHDDCEQRLTFTTCFMDAMAEKPNITWTELRGALKELISDIRSRYEETQEPRMSTPKVKTE